MKKLLIAAIRFYRLAVSPWTPPSCRYVPTCSAYAREAVERHGPARGCWLALRRVLRCHPFGGYGPDPVPPAPSGASGREETRPGSNAGRGSSRESEAPFADACTSATAPTGDRR